MSGKLTEAIDNLEGLDYLMPHDLEYESWLEVTAAARRWASFPTDEDVEAAAKAIAGRGWTAESYHYSAARAALEAVKREDR